MEGFFDRLALYYTDSQTTTTPAKGVVVFLHGFPFDHTLWDAQAALLARDFRVITYDQRGLGRSSVPLHAYLFESFVDDLLTLLDHLHVTRAVLCGLSMGGYVALRCAERSPETIQGLVLCDTRSEADTNAVKLKRSADLRIIREQGMEAFADNFLKSVFSPVTGASKPNVVHAVRNMILSCPSEGIQKALVALATRTDTTGALSNLRAPSLVLVGEDDRITPPSAARELHQRLPDSELVLIPEAGHLSNLENEAAFNSALSRFMSRFVS